MLEFLSEATEYKMTVWGKEILVLENSCICHLLCDRYLMESCSQWDSHDSWGDRPMNSPLEYMCKKCIGFSRKIEIV